MKIAFISDIHSNLYALQSVLNDIIKQNVEDIYCLGDIVGYHSFPNETIELIIKENIKCIKGNHDRDISEKHVEEIRKEEFIKQWTYNTLTEKNRLFLKELPETINITIGKKKVKLVHGSSKSITEYLFEDNKKTKEVAENLEEDMLMCAHTHIPYIKKYGEKVIINTGSVGKPKIGEPKSTYILLTQNEQENISAEIRYVEYDFKRAAEDLMKKGFPQKYADELIKGKSL